MQKIVGMASLPDRESAALRSIESIINQVDKVYVALNGYNHIPLAWQNNPKIHCDILDNSLYGDAAKFYHVEECKDSYYFAIDDDLLFPEGYIDYLILGINKYNGLVSLHGRNYPIPFVHFKRWVGSYRCLGEVNSDVRVNFIGSGCCGFNTNQLKLSIKDFKSRNMADVYLSRAAYLQNVPMYVLRHKTGYIDYLSPKTTIWQQTSNYSVHNEVLRSFLKK